ncbi:MAG TPA: TonB-dependent receptor plug domain-containing protein [Puia sp.]|nr:TonB-dependent receptor plug domain-containing protein [Puia sp.]
MNYIGIFKNLLLLLAAGISLEAQAQQDSTVRHPYETMSLKDLLNVKIVSASRQTEALLDAPLSASVLTRAEIERAGCTTIMEALRLVPGMIVREETNGNYDIELRGLDNVPPDAIFDVTANTTTLVMIDNRPVYSYLRGGTFWETLPVALHDVDRIEVVRGPSAALYGPNAVNGVINIITRQAKNDGLYLNAGMLQGSSLTYVNNLAAGYRFNSRWSVIASGNYESRDRTQQSYYEFQRNRYLSDPAYFVNYTGDTIRNVHQQYPDQPMAVDKYAGNIFVNGELSPAVKFSLSSGLQHSTAERVSTENEFTPLSTTFSESRYVDLRSTIHNLSVQLSYNGGTQSLSRDTGARYDFFVAGGSAEYTYTHGQLTIKPSVSYTSAVYNDLRYADTVEKDGLLNTRGVIESRRGGLQSEYRLFDNKLRLIAAMGASSFNHPDKMYFSYEFAATYKLSRTQLVRAVYSEAPRSSNIFDTYVSKDLGTYQTGYQQYITRVGEGNPNVRLMSARMFEVGYRGEFGREFSADLELFAIDAGNYNTPVETRPYAVLQGADTFVISPIRPTTLPMRLQQQGATINLHWKHGAWDVNPFFSVQHTECIDFAPYANTPDAGTPNAATQNIYSGIGANFDLPSTPVCYGGASANYKVNDWLNLNLSAYAYTMTTYYHVSNVIYNDGVRGIDHIPGKAIVNANIIFTPARGLRLFITGKNLLNENYREYFKTDAIPLMVMGGIKYDF